MYSCFENNCLLYGNVVLRIFAESALIKNIQRRLDAIEKLEKLRSMFVKFLWTYYTN